MILMVYMFYKIIPQQYVLWKHIVMLNKQLYRKLYLNPSNPSLEPFIVRTGALAYAFATRLFLSKTITFAQISSSIWFHLSKTSCMWSCIKKRHGFVERNSNWKQKLRKKNKHLTMYKNYLVQFIQIIPYILFILLFVLWFHEIISRPRKYLPPRYHFVI